jgi:hypothetical protein
MLTTAPVANVFELVITHEAPASTATVPKSVKLVPRPSM